MISGTQLIEEVRRLALAYPDRVSEAQYAKVTMEGVVPVCIFGHALVALGVSPELMYEDVAYRNVAIHQVSTIAFTEAEAKWASDVQFNQDAHFRWGFAVLDTDRLAYR